jgi:Xaa-Pro aminopeptidase
VVEATADHYMASVERAIALGDLLPKQQKYYDAVIESLKKTIAMCAPGVACSAIDRAGQKVFQQAGYDNFLCGTGLSRGLLNPFEGRLDKSNLRIYNDYLLRANMVLSIEPYAIAPDVGAQRHCEMVLVTETGNEVLSKAPNGYLKIN